MNANLMTGTIVMSRNEARKAGKLGTDEYKELAELMQRFANFRIEVVKPSAKKADHFKGLTRDFMKQYIEKHNMELMAEFYTLCGLDEHGRKTALVAAASYGELKMWFLEQFPEIEQMSENIAKIMDKTREARAARKAS